MEIPPLEGRFGDWLKKYREQRDLTQAELGVELGVTESTIGSWEQNRLEPGKAVAQKFAKRLDLPEPQQVAFLKFARPRTAAQQVTHPGQDKSDETKPKNSWRNWIRRPWSATLFIGVLVGTMVGGVWSFRQASIGQRTRRPVIVFLPGPSTRASAQNDFWNKLWQFKGPPYVAVTLYSYNGGFLNPDGTWNPNDYGCEHAYQHLDISVQALQDMLRIYSERHPGSDFLLVGHSVGGTVAWKAVMDSLKVPGNDDNLRKNDSRIAALVTWGAPLSAPGERLPIVARTLTQVQPCQDSVYEEPASAILASLPSIEESSELVQELQRNQIDLVPFVSTQDDVGVSGTLESNVAGTDEKGLQCDFGRHADYINSPLLWDNMNSYLHNTHFSQDSQSFALSCPGSRE